MLKIYIKCLFYSHYIVSFFLLFIIGIFQVEPERVIIILMKLKGIIFDVDGTIADTEEIHRQAFNQTFREFDLDWNWSVSDYQRLLAISGGQERLKSCLSKDEVLKSKLEIPNRFIQELHRKKSENYRILLGGGNIQARLGIIRLIREAQDNNIMLGIATSSSGANLRVLIDKIMQTRPETLFSAIATSDTVFDKKPSPVVYQCVLAGLGLMAENCVVIEDTCNGNRAALDAGLKTIITTHQYTVDNDFDGASLVVNHLGEPDRPFVIANGDACDKTRVDTELLNRILAGGDESVSTSTEAPDMISDQAPKRATSL